MSVNESLSTIITQLWIIVLIQAVMMGIAVGSLFVVLYLLLSDTRRCVALLHYLDKKMSQVEAGKQEKGEREECIHCSREKEEDEEYSASQYDPGWMSHDMMETADDGGQYGRNSKGAASKIPDIEVENLERRDTERKELGKRGFARSQEADANVVCVEKNIRVQLCNPDEAIRYNEYSGLRESPEGEVVIYEQKGSEFYARPVEDSMVEKDYYRTAIKYCFDVNLKVEAGYSYNVEVEESCVLKKEGEVYRVVKKGKLYLEKDSRV